MEQSQINNHGQAVWELIDEYGRHMSESGLSSCYGRLMGLLLFSDKEEFSFEEIVEELQVSKSTASTAINFLLNLEKIESVSHKGDRKRYFRIKIDSANQFIEKFEKRITQFEKLCQKGLELKPDQNTRNSKFLSKNLVFLNLFKKAILNIMLQENNQKLNNE